MKNKKKVLFTLLVGSLLAGLAAVGCSSADNTSVSKLELVDFADKTVTVEVGEQYVPDITSVLDEAGNAYTPKITAQTMTGDSVWVQTDGSFKVSQMTGYKVLYTVENNGSKAQRVVTVNCKDTTAPTLRFLGVRTEILADKYTAPNVYVTDNSGEELTADVKCYKVEGETLTEILCDQNSYLFEELGSYKYVAKVADSNGNESTAEKEFNVIEMDDYVWEDFANANRLENVIVDENETCFTTTEWLDTFEGAQGVAKISPNYYPVNPWGQGDYVAIRLNKTYEQLVRDQWGTFTIRMYIEGAKKHVKQADGSYLATTDATSVSLQNESLSLGSYRTGEWVNVVISRKDFFQDKKALAFKTFNTNKTLKDRYDQFATMYTISAPCYLFRAAAGAGGANYYIDSITWTEAEEDVTAPVISYQGGTVEAALGSTVSLPTVVATDDWDATPSVTSNLYYRNVNTGIDELVKASGGKFVAEKLGEYYLDVKAKDSSNNTSTDQFTIHVVQSIDEHIITSNKYPEQVGVFTAAKSENFIKGYESTSSTEWLEEFEGKSGVSKVVVDNTNQYGFGWVKMYVPQNVIDAMVDSFGYVTLSLYIEVADVVKDDITTFNFYPNPDGHGNHTDIPVGQWTTITINRAEFMKAGDDNTALATNLLKGSRPSLYSNQVKWNSTGEYVIINGKNTNTLSGEDAYKAGIVTFYVDEIRWDEDTTAPDIEIDNQTAYVGTQFDFMLDVTDQFDPSAVATEVKMYKGEYATVESLVNATAVNLTELEGVYSYVVPAAATAGEKYTVCATAKDSSGNTTTKLFVVTVQTPLAPDVISELNNADTATSYFYTMDFKPADNHTTNSSVTYLNSYDEATGVVKVVADNANGGAAQIGNVALKLSAAEYEALQAKSSDYDYIVIRMQVQTNLPYEGLTLCFGPNKTGTDYYNYNVAPGEWFDFKISLSNITNAITNSNTTTVTRANFWVSNVKYNGTSQIRYQLPYGNAIHTYTTAAAPAAPNAAMTYGLSAETLASYSVITYYIDSVKLGKDVADTTAPEGKLVYQSGKVTITAAESGDVAIGAYFTDNYTHPTVTLDGVYMYDATKENGCGTAVSYTTVNAGTIRFSASSFASGTNTVVFKYKAVDKAGNVSYIYAQRTVVNNYVVS